MKFQNQKIILNFERMDGRTSPKQYAPSTFSKLEAFKKQFEISRLSSSIFEKTRRKLGKVFTKY